MDERGNMGPSLWVACVRVWLSGMVRVRFIRPLPTTYLLPMVYDKLYWSILTDLVGWPPPIPALFLYWR